MWKNSSSPASRASWRRKRRDRGARSALGRDVPRAGLYVTGSHALLVDDLLVPAWRREAEVLYAAKLLAEKLREADERHFAPPERRRGDVGWRASK